MANSSSTLQRLLLIAIVGENHLPKRRRLFFWTKSLNFFFGRSGSSFAARSFSRVNWRSGVDTCSFRGLLKDLDWSACPNLVKSFGIWVHGMAGDILRLMLICGFEDSSLYYLLRTRRVLSLISASCLLYAWK
ncbi:uncharacterized protein LOC120250048 [Dioscorea cayenensis subsp. rotundata]|uniref:Uncharacterized protein LOC120250048 n=1 Tax=Dioscorea cayennensis subsp. rotundata TaxID=55577 RepID=A0AB40AIM7_DIOCR|nr:uncharacterized protein LOC120250048 [Dioscorea cayenensis subsp. rotundata]